LSFSSAGRSGYPRDGKVTGAGLTATVLHCLGLGPWAEVRDTQNRPFPAGRGEVIRAVL
jgi:hypothetical protein